MTIMRDTKELGSSDESTSTPGSPTSTPGSPTSTPGSPGSSSPRSPRIRRSPDFLKDDLKQEPASLQNEAHVTTKRFTASDLQHLQNVLQQQATLTSLMKTSNAKVLVAESLSKIPNLIVGSIERDGEGKTLSFITEHIETKLSLKKIVGEGNNGVVRLATIENSKENIVVKSISVYNKDTYNKTRKLVLDKELISRIIHEHANMNLAGLNSKLIYDPASMTLYVTMPQYPGVTVKKMLSGKGGLADQLGDKINKSEDAAALFILRDMLSIYKGALQVLKDFHIKTATKGTALVHGDAWTDNVMVYQRANGSFEFNLIDYGACCGAGITGTEYLEQKLQVGIGDFHTAPEIPSKSNKNLQELYAKITAQSDLHAITASFIFDALLGVFDTESVEENKDKNKDNITAIAKDFMLWAMVNACNSDWFYHTLGKDEPIIVQAMKIRGDVTKEGSVAKRASMQEAMDKVQEYIARIDVLVNEVYTNQDRANRYKDLYRATRGVDIAERVQAYNRVARPQTSKDHHEHPH